MRVIMILSVSRRTDIPNYYSDWFFNRVKAGFVNVRNPLNTHQISQIKITPDIVDCIVFWTKNPIPIMARLDELNGYQYYFQFTLTGYGNDVEKNLPDKKTMMIPAFRKLSQNIGKDKIIWRYDPIFFSKRYTMNYHLKAFKHIAESLKGFTNQCVISFVDTYAKNKNKLEQLLNTELHEQELRKFAKELSEIANKNHILLSSCAEKIDLSELGIRHNCCIDKDLIENIIGCKLKVSKDKNQRKECGCIESVDIGTYNTCKNGCVYCYANYSQVSVERNALKFNPLSPLLCGEVTAEDKINQKDVKTFKKCQFNFFDLSAFT